jgi:hypothetical protein
MVCFRYGLAWRTGLTIVGGWFCLYLGVQACEHYNDCQNSLFLPGLCLMLVYAVLCLLVSM